MSRQLKPAANISASSPIERLSEAAYYQDAYIVLVVTPRGVYSASTIPAEEFKENGMLTASRNLWRAMWQGVRGVEQHNEWLAEHPQGTEFDIPSGLLE